MEEADSFIKMMEREVASGDGLAEDKSCCLYLAITLMQESIIFK